MEGPSDMVLDNDAPSTSTQPAEQQQQQFQSPQHVMTATASGTSPRFWSSKSRVTYNDRFIPSRTAAARLDFSILDREIVASEVSNRASEREDFNPAYNLLLRSELLGSPCHGPMSPDRGQQLDQLRSPCSPGKKLFRYKVGDPLSPHNGNPPPYSPFSLSPVGDDTLGGSQMASPRRMQRKISRAPFKVLDAPLLQDDFYLNLLDWSSQNVMAVGLAGSVYLWSANSGKVEKLCELPPEDTTCSVAWSQRGTYLSVGSMSGKVAIYDVNKLKIVRTMEGHKARVGALSWSSSTLASGSKDKSILLRDVRAADHFHTKLGGHRSEVCGLKWSPDDRQLASGGNDNNLFVWSPTSDQPLFHFTQHVAAVKAITWSPHQHNLLASGGGTSDRTIRFWNTASGIPLHSVDTGSQVCNMAWAKNVNEIVSTHGYSQNQIVVWKYPSMSKVATLVGHNLRVLYLACSPDGQTIVTGAGDETLRFWSVFPGASKLQGIDNSVASMTRSLIR